MKTIIVGMDGCPNCRRLNSMLPGADYVCAKQEDILPLARALKITAMPFIVQVGTADELAEKNGDCSGQTGTC